MVKNCNITEIMKAESIIKIRKTLEHSDRITLQKLCLRLAKFKIENINYANYSYNKDLITGKIFGKKFKSKIDSNFKNISFKFPGSGISATLNFNENKKNDLINGQFNPLIDDENIENPEKLVFCSGKFFYDLIDFREKNQIKNVAIVRIEQLFPLPVKSIKKLIDKYNVNDVVWAQEEPRNMGAWGHILMHLDFAKSFRVASRRFYSSPASGSAVRFKRRHNQVIEYVFDEKKDNFKK